VPQHMHQPSLYAAPIHASDDMQDFVFHERSALGLRGNSACHGDIRHRV
jgi:hypothetical protein